MFTVDVPDLSTQLPTASSSAALLLEPTSCKKSKFVYYKKFMLKDAIVDILYSLNEYLKSVSVPLRMLVPKIIALIAPVLTTVLTIN